MSKNGISQLSVIRRKAIRMGAWFTILSRAERGLVDLTIRCVDRIKSCSLAAALVKALAKLLNYVRSTFLSKIEELGRPLAEGLSAAAASWGNKEAVKWVYNLSFIRLTGLNALRRMVM